MSVDVFWFLPTSGDTRYLGQSEFGRAPSLEYLRQIATTSEHLGYDGILIPTGSSCFDPWIVASSLIPVTSRIKVLVALRTSQGAPIDIARRTATLDRGLNGRLILNIVPGGDPVELAADGIFLEHDERYEHADEFITIWKRVLSGEVVDFDGKYLKVKGAASYYPPVQKPHPQLFFGGSSPAAHELTAKHIDAYLTWGEPPAQVKEKIDDIRERAVKYGRTVKFGVRLQTIVRETTAEAWADANRLISRLTDDDISRAQENFARQDSIAQKRITSLHGGRRDKLEISPNLWAGIGLIRGGAGTALVGDAATVAERLQEYVDLGVDRFVLSGYPHLEESIRFAELVFPLLGKPRPNIPADRPITGGAFDTRWQYAF